MAFLFSKLPRCGAKARSNGGKPCRQAVVMNGSERCHWHGGSAAVRHTRYTKKAKAERRSNRKFIGDIRKAVPSLTGIMDDR
jgi:hypothetical protein